MTSGPTGSKQRRPPGRPRSEQTRVAVLRAAAELLREVGPRLMTIDEIAARSGTSKATIYKWWPNKYAVAVEAFLAELPGQEAVPDTGSAREDLRRVVRELLRFAAGSGGRVYAQLVAEAQFDPTVAKEFRDRLMGSRLAALRAVRDRGVARGELSPDVPAEVAMDLVFGAVTYRLLAGHEPLDEAAADRIVDAALRGLAR